MAAKVLIVDDNDDCRMLMALLIARLGYTVLEAGNGLEAIEKAVSGNPQLIVMDLRMPKMDGLEATRRLKDNPRTEKIPIVICTALGGEAYPERDLVDYAAEIIRKPVHIEAIQALLLKYLPPPVAGEKPLSSIVKKCNLHGRA